MNFETCDVETLLLFKEDAELKNDAKQRKLLKVLLTKLIKEGKSIVQKSNKTSSNKNVATLKRLNTNKLVETVKSRPKETFPKLLPIKIEVISPVLSSLPPELLCAICQKPFDTKETHKCGKQETNESSIKIEEIKIEEINITEISKFESDNEESNMEGIDIAKTSEPESDGNNTWFEECFDRPAAESEGNNTWFEESFDLLDKSKNRRRGKKQIRVYRDKSHYDELIVFQCSICDKDFLIETELDEHIKTHNSEHIEIKKFKCKECTKVLPTKKGLKVHISNIHSKDWLKYKCSQCNRVFKSKPSMQHHISEDHDLKTDRTCHICSKLFSNKYKCERHVKSVHQRLYSRVCPICGKVVLDMTGLQRHIDGHSDLKPWQCDQCSLAFKIKADLTVHLRIHTGERPYACTVCLRKFTSNSNLHKHMKSHGDYVIVKNEGFLK